MVRFIRDARSLPPWQIAAGLVVAAAVAGLIFWFMADGPGARLISPPGSRVASFTGTGDEVTASFDVRRGWKMEWSIGEAATIAIRGDQNMGDVVTTDQPASGTTDPPAGGVFHLEVTTEGEWAITILQGD